MPNYTKLRATAKRLVEGAGRAVTVRRRNDTPADATMPWRGPADPAAVPNAVSVACIGVFTAITYGDDDDGTRRAFSGLLVAASSVLTEDDPPVDVDLRNFDEVVDGSDVWSITEAIPVQPGPVCLLWKLTLKK